MAFLNTLNDIRSNFSHKCVKFAANKESSLQWLAFMHVKRDSKEA